jgi:hypothetical protein
VVLIGKPNVECLRRCNETAISLKAGCQLFLRYITRTSALEMENFEAAKARIIEVRGFPCKDRRGKCSRPGFSPH